MRLNFFVVALALVFSGCVTSGALLNRSSVSAPAAPHGIESLVLPMLVQDHDHADAKAHAMTVGFDALGHVDGFGGKLPPGTSYGEMAVKGDYAYVSFSTQNGPGVGGGGFSVTTAESGFFIFDVGDPSAPKLVSKTTTQPSGDLEVSDDGHWLFLGVQRSGYPYPYSVAPANGPTGDVPRGIYVYDVSDKAHPKFESFEPIPPNGPHTLTWVNMDGRQLVLACTYDLLFLGYPNNVGQAKPTQKVVISELVVDPSGRHVLKPLSIFQRLDPDADGKEYFPHDATMQKHPITGKWLMYVAYWDLGMVIVDMSDPSNPKAVSQFADVSPSHLVHTHRVAPFPALLGARHVSVMEPEIPTGDETSQFTFVDTTDPAHPQKLGSWKLPGNLTVDKPFIFSPHNFDLHADGRVALSHNHGGLWVLDASDPTHPIARSFFFPDAAFPKGSLPGFGTAWWKGDVVFAPEYTTGLYTLRYDPDAGPTAMAHESDGRS